MAADHSGAVARAYGVYNAKTGMAYRARFIISPDGVVKAVEVLTPPLGRNVNELIRQIKALQTIAKHPGKAAPAGWEPGKKLIGTGKDYIGVY